MKYNIPADATTVSEFTTPGMYPMFYVTKGLDVICPTCVNKDIAQYKDLNNDSYVAGISVNWEDTNLYCDECGERIESAYAEGERP
jgi:hypothetical protein